MCAGALDNCGSHRHVLGAVLLLPSAICLHTASVIRLSLNESLIPSLSQKFCRIVALTTYRTRLTLFSWCDDDDADSAGAHGHPHDKSLEVCVRLTEGEIGVTHAHLYPSLPAAWEL